MPASHKTWVEAAEGKPEPGHGALLGKQWQPLVIAEHAYNAGWHDAKDLRDAVAICLAESQGFDRAIHVNLDGSEDRGAWQLNSIHKNITDYVAYDLIAATDEAFKLFAARRRAGQTGFEDWAAFTRGVYLHDSYLGRATRGVGNFLAADMLKHPVPDRADGTPYIHAFRGGILNFEHRLAGAVHHIDLAGKTLGWQPASRVKVQAAQAELAKARTAARQPLPN